MKTVITIPELRQERLRLVEPVGLVPTMGYLHAGHLSLVKAAKAGCNSVIVSIFVNPSQFGPQEDLSTYPRDLPRDLHLLESVNTDLVWTPTPQSMYPSDYQTWVTVEKVTQRLEGEQRPGHFRGVATVVAKLFNATQPHKAYFGQKDAQQAIVIRQMAQDLNFPLEIVVCPTVREPDGLAMSSRNVYLDPGERQAATILHQALTTAQATFESGERDAEKLREIVREIIHQEPLASLQYVSCADALTLEELEGSFSVRAVLSLAAYFSRTRLIDNVILDN
jgi:pantoate--beta-alanine ligase